MRSGGKHEYSEVRVNHALDDLEGKPSSDPPPMPPEGMGVQAGIGRWLRHLRCILILAVLAIGTASATIVFLAPTLSPPVHRSRPPPPARPASDLAPSIHREAPLCVVPKLSAKVYEFADQPVDGRTGLVRWIGLDQAGAAATFHTMKHVAGLDKLSNEQILDQLPTVDDGNFGTMSSSWCDELTHSLHRTGLEAVFIKLLRVPDGGAVRFRNQTYGSHFAMHSFGAWVMSMREDMGWSIEEVFKKLQRAAVVALLASRIKPRLAWDAFEFEGVFHGAIWQMITNPSEHLPQLTADPHLLGKYVRVLHHHMNNDFMYTPYHGLGHGAVYAALSQAQNLDKGGDARLFPCTGGYKFMLLPPFGLDVNVSTLLKAEAICLQAGSTYHRTQSPFVPYLRWQCIQGVYHGFWEIQRINASAPWTWYCGSVRVAATCLIVRHYLKPYGGLASAFTGRMPSLQECLAAGDAGESQRLGCILAVSYSNFRAYDEALYAAAHKVMHGPGRCGSLLFTRAPTNVTGVASELLDDGDWHLARTTERAESYMPNATLLRWCAKVLQHTSTATGRSLARRRILMCLRGAAATIPAQVRPEACSSVMMDADAAALLSTSDLDRACVRAPLAWDSLLHENACEVDPPCEAPDIAPQSRYWQGRTNSAASERPWFW